MPASGVNTSASSFTGAVQTQSGGKWGTLCADGISGADQVNVAKAVCKSLGLKNGTWDSSLTSTTQGGSVNGFETSCGTATWLSDGSVNDARKMLSDDTVCTQKSFESYFSDYKLGLPKDSSGNKQAWASQTYQNGSDGAFEDCKQLPGCIAVGQSTTGTTGPSFPSQLSQRTRFCRHPKSTFGSNSAFITHINQLSWPYGQCDVTNTADFSSQNNVKVCNGGNNYNVGSRATIRFEALANKKQHFSPRIDFGGGGLVEVNGTVLAHTHNDLWQPSSNTGEGALDVSFTALTGENVVVIQGQESCCEGLQSILFAIADTKPSMKGDGWLPVTRQNLDEAASTTATLSEFGEQANMHLFFDRANPQNSNQVTPLQLPPNAIAKVQRQSGIASTLGSGAASTTRLSEKIAGQPTFTKVLTYNKLNTGASENFSKQMDGSSAASSGLTANKDGGGDQVYMTQDGTLTQTAATTEMTCTLCLRAEKEIGAYSKEISYVLITPDADGRGKIPIKNAQEICGQYAGSLPKADVWEEFRNIVQNNEKCASGPSMPLRLQRDNQNQYQSSSCTHENDIAVTCDNWTFGVDTATTEDDIHIRLINKDNVIQYSITYDDIITHDQITAKQYRKPENAWHDIGEQPVAGDMGIYLQFRMSKIVRGIGLESNIWANWVLEQFAKTGTDENGQETYEPDITNQYFGSEIYPVTENALSLDYTHSGKVKGDETGFKYGTQFVYLRDQLIKNKCSRDKAKGVQQMKDQGYNQNDCSEALITADRWKTAESGCDASAGLVSEHVFTSCIIYVELWQFQQAKISNSVTWNQQIQFDPNMDEIRNDFTMFQFKDPNTKVIEGLTQKAGDFIKCQFDKKNPPTKVGAPVTLFCSYDSNFLDGVQTNYWRQGRICAGGCNDPGKPLDEINNYCTGCPGSVTLTDQNDNLPEDFPEGWTTLKFIADQQQNGLSVYHKIQLAVKQKKEWRRRQRLRRLANAAGETGSIASEVPLGCIADEDEVYEDVCDKKETPVEKVSTTTTTGEGGFSHYISMLVAFLALMN